MKIGLEMDDNTLLFTQLPAEEVIYPLFSLTYFVLDC